VLLAKYFNPPRSPVRITMLLDCLKFTRTLKCLLSQDSGQDLVEYALVVALIAFGCTAGMQSLAGGINTAFLNIVTVLGNYTV
jgi:pilus assembly protein Flp/PilA